MRYSIMNFSQSELLKYDLDLTDVLLLDYIQKALSQPSMTKIVKNNQPYVWLYHSKILEDLPILKIKQEALKKRLANLVKKRLIQSEIVYDANGRGTKAFYTITTKFETLQNTPTQDDTTRCIEIHQESGAGVFKSTSDNKLTNNTNNTKETITKDTKDIKEIKLKSNKENKGRKLDWFLDKYHEICVSFPKVRSLTARRKQAILDLMNKYSEEDILEMFSKAEKSDFLKGKNDRGWKANIDFMLREDKFISILEDKYGGSNSVRERIEHMHGPSTHMSKEEKEKLRRDIADGKVTRY